MDNQRSQISGRESVIHMCVFRDISVTKALYVQSVM